MCRRSDRKLKARWVDPNNLIIPQYGYHGIVLIPREAAPSFRNDAAPLFRELLAP